MLWWQQSGQRSGRLMGPWRGEKGSQTDMIKGVRRGTGGVARQLSLLSFPEDLGSTPIPTWGFTIHSSLTPVPMKSIPSSGPHRHCTHKITDRQNTYTHKAKISRSLREEIK